jgi:eukaryotic-like serine/threonine-protein kinase
LGENRTGKWEVFVASFPSFHNIKEVSLAGGVQPRWCGDGKELFFIDPQGELMSATVERGSAFKIGIPRRLFDTGLVPDPTVNQYAVTEDGLKFPVLEPHKGFHETYSVVFNWPKTVK